MKNWEFYKALHERVTRRRRRWRGNAKRERQLMKKLNAREVYANRARIAWAMKQLGVPYRHIAQVMRCGPDDARKLVARGDKLEARHKTY